MKNAQYDRLIAQLKDLQPDIVFLTEVDEGWTDALEPALSAYRHTLFHPQSNTFGKAFASRLPVLNADLLEASGAEDTPSVFALLRASDDLLVQFVGLHPKAPLPWAGRPIRTSPDKAKAPPDALFCKRTRRGPPLQLENGW